MYLALRRVFEVLSIIIFSPILFLLIIILGLLIKLESKGPVFFIQPRIGKGGICFQMIKLRSMYVGSDLKTLTTQYDSRITKVGKFIRKWKLDELPQLYHILTGEMAMIGPRPVPASWYEEYCRCIKDYNLRHTVRPGITGLAQVRLGYTNELEGERAKSKWDIYYIDHLGWRLDLYILILTLTRK